MPGTVTQAGQYTIGIVGYVPVICRTHVDANMITPEKGTFQLGTLNNFCNSPNGYRVYADYSPSLAHAQMLVDGAPVALAKGGSTLITSSDRASIDQHELALAVSEGRAVSGSISFRIEPL